MIWFYLIPCLNVMVGVLAGFVLTERGFDIDIALESIIAWTAVSAIPYTIALVLYLCYVRQTDLFRLFFYLHTSML